VKRIILASSNPGKVQEIQQLLTGCGVEIVLQSDLGIADVAETGFTFVENAILKARHAATLSGLPAMADDSGLEVDALNGAPGIYSARYAGPGSSDTDNNARLLRELKDIPDELRSARFQCVTVYMRHAKDAMPLVCTGTWEGRILLDPRGKHGFGYDPLFYVSTHQCSSAELPPDVKNKISHRARALQALREAFACHHQY
jgi:non-canonical purine NTP pyrophosphatase (RdgB/HAM1 family)